MEAVEDAVKDAVEDDGLAATAAAEEVDGEVTLKGLRVG